MSIVHRERIHGSKRTVAPLAERSACELNPAMTFKGFVSLGHSKMDGDWSALLAQEVKQHKRLFHTVRPNHADVLLQEPSDKKQQAVRIECGEYGRGHPRSVESDESRQRQHPLQDGECY